MADRQTIERLKDQALEMRELILKLSAKTLIHLGGDLSMADMMTALYMYKMKKNLDYDGKWPERDRFVLSKGHGAAVSTSPWPWRATAALTRFSRPTALGQPLRHAPLQKPEPGHGGLLRLARSRPDALLRAGPSRKGARGQASRFHPARRRRVQRRSVWKALCWPRTTSLETWWL